MNLSKTFIWQLTSNLAFVCFSETWVDEISFNKNSNFQLSGYQVLHQTRKNHKGGGVCDFVHEILNFKLREDQSINCDAIQSLSTEILFSILSTGHLTVILKNVKLILKMYFQKMAKT